MSNTKMKRNRFLAVVALFLMAAVFTGCGRSEEPVFAEGNTGSVNAAWPAKDEAEFLPCQQAAEQGDADAQYRFARLLIAQDFDNTPEAVKWYIKAAEKGHEGAQRELAEMDFNHFWPVKRQDFEEAVKWRKKAAEEGNPKAMGLLGWHYATGRGVERDYKTAVEWFRKGAELNNAESQFGMGESIRKSWLARYDEAKDWKTVIDWYVKAADNGLLKVDWLIKLREPDRDRIESDPEYAEWIGRHRPIANPDEGVSLPCQISNMYRKKYYELITSSRWEDAELSAQCFAEAAKWARKAVEMRDQDGLSMLVGLATEGCTVAEDAIRALAEDEKIPDLFREKAADYVEGYRLSGEWRPGSELEVDDFEFGEELDEEDENVWEDENAGADDEETK